MKEQRPKVNGWDVYDPARLHSLNYTNLAEAVAGGVHTESAPSRNFRVLIPRSVLVDAAAKYLNETMFKEPVVVKALGPMGLDEVAVECSPVMKELAKGENK